MTAEELRALDRQVAEKVLGWGPIDTDHNGNPCGLNPAYPGPFRCHIVPKYSTNHQDAWTVVEKLENEGWSLAIDCFSKSLYTATFWKGFSFEDAVVSGTTAGAPTIQEAICVAALNAKSSEAALEKV